MHFNTRNYLCIIIIVSVCVKEIATRTVTKTDHNDAKERQSLVQLFRIKRFDFNMFGCGCRPVVQCKRDSDCHESHGDDYKCSVNCCTFLCIHNSDSKSPPGNRDFGQYQSHNRGSEHPNGQNGHGHQGLTEPIADAADDYSMSGDAINNVEVNINNALVTTIATLENTVNDMGTVTHEYTEVTNAKPFVGGSVQTVATKPDNTREVERP